MFDLPVLWMSDLQCTSTNVMKYICLYVVGSSRQNAILISTFSTVAIHTQLAVTVRLLVQVYICSRQITSSFHFSNKHLLFFFSQTKHQSYISQALCIPERVIILRYCEYCKFFGSNILCLQSHDVIPASSFLRLRPNVTTTPITAMGCLQCLPLSLVQLKGKHCRKPHYHNRVVDTFEIQHDSL